MRIASLLALPFALLACEPRSVPDRPEGGVEAPVPLPNPDDPESFVGLYLTDAQSAATQAGVPHRVVERDGESLAHTMDFRPERLNFSVLNGKVIKVTKG